MPLDTTIALQTRLPESRSPLTTLGSLARLSQEQQLGRERTLINDARQRQLEDDDAIRSTLQRVGNPDGAIAELYQTGRANAAATLSKNVFDYRKAVSEQADRHLTAQKKTIDMLAQIAQSANDQQSWTTARTAMQAVADPVMPEVMQHVPMEYDPKMQKQLIDYGTSVSDKLKTQQDAIQNGHRAMEIALTAARDHDQHLKNQQEANKYWTAAASNLLSTAGSQDEWDIYQRMLASQGAPVDVLAQFGNRHSPEAVTRAKALGMSAAEEASAAHAKKLEAVEQGNLDERVRHDKEEEGATAGGPGARPLTPNQRREADQWKATQYQRLERDLRTQYPADVTGKWTLPDDAKEEVGNRKVQIENDWRAQVGLPSIFDAEHQAASQQDAMSLRKVRNVYKQLTGQETPLEQMEKLATSLKSEKDSAKARSIRDRLAALRARYGELVGR